MIETLPSCYKIKPASHVVGCHLGIITAWGLAILRHPDTRLPRVFNTESEATRYAIEHDRLHLNYDQEVPNWKG